MTSANASIAERKAKVERHDGAIVVSSSMDGAEEQLAHGYGLLKLLRLVQKKYARRVPNRISCLVEGSLRTVTLGLSARSDIPGTLV